MHALIDDRSVSLSFRGCALAAAVGGWWNEARKGLWKMVVAGGVLALGLAASVWTLVRTWPDYLAYFNPFAPHPEQVLVDSDLDWGQDFKRLTKRLAELKVPSISLAYLGTADLNREPLPSYRLLNNPEQPVTGWVAVSALARAYAPGHLAWLRAYPVRERIGKTIDLYYIPPGVDERGADVK